jgi:phospholipid N-methyltransferase
LILLDTQSNICVCSRIQGDTVETEVLAVEITKLELGPGDVLVVQLKHEAIRSMERVREFSDHLHKVLGHDRFIILDADAVELQVAKRPADHVQD